MNTRNIILFDGACSLCNEVVMFLINRDPQEKFLFASIQSKFAQELINKHQAENVGIDTFLLVKSGNCFTYTDAVLEITKELSGFWQLFRVLKIVPRPIRDFFYRIIARNRHRFFGKKTECMYPSEETKSRFLGI